MGQGGRRVSQPLCWGGGGDITLLAQEVDLALSKQLLFVAVYHVGFCPGDVRRRDDVDDAGNPQSLAHVHPSVHTRHVSGLEECFLGGAGDSVLLLPT